MYQCLLRLSFNLKQGMTVGEKGVRNIWMLSGKDTKNWLLQKMVYMPKTCGRRLSNSLTMVTMMVQSLVEI